MKPEVKNEFPLPLVVCLCAVSAIMGMLAGICLAPKRTESQGGSYTPLCPSSHLYKGDRVYWKPSRAGSLKTAIVSDVIPVIVKMENGEWLYAENCSKTPHEAEQNGMIVTQREP